MGSAGQPKKSNPTNFPPFNLFYTIFYPSLMQITSLGPINFTFTIEFCSGGGS